MVGGAGVILVLGHVGMLIPARVDGFVGVVDLDEADAALGKAAGHEALAAVVLSCFFADAIHRLGGFGFTGEIKNVGRIHLHPKGEVEGVDSSVEILVAFALRLLPVELLEEVELFLL